MPAHKNLIAGDWLDGVSVSRNVNPSDTRDVVGEYAQADKAQTERAIAAAKAAFPKWSRSTPQERSDALEKVAAEILARKDELGRLLAREEGKTLPEGIGEVARAGHIFRFFAGEALRMAGEKIASTRPNVEVEITREALGVVGLITPWNFPIAIPAWKIAPALAYGNCVVIKPADLVPGSVHALAEIIARAGFPKGVFNLAMGRGSVVGDTLINHPDVTAISFTGSVATGRKVAAACVARMATLVTDDALKPGTHVGPVVDQNQLDQDLSYLNIGRDEGATLAAGGELLNLATPGFYLAPALFTGVDNSMRVAREEIFGPIACVIAAKDYDEALAIANDTPFGLVSGICTTSLKHATHFKRNAEAGMVMVNLPTAGVDYHVPFGGRKGSSYGPREQGRYAAEFYTSVKTAYVMA